MEKSHRMEKKTQLRTSSFLLLLFLLLWSPGAQCEMCRSWMFGISRGTRNLTGGLPAGWGPYRCPRKTEPPAYRFCCGTCLQPYCCPWEESRLDQEACLDNEELKQLTPQELAAIPTLRHVETSPPATSPPATSSRARAYLDYGLPVLMTILVIASFGVLSWTIFCRLRRLEDSLQLLQSFPLPDADDPPSTSVAAEALHVSKPTVDPKASSPDVEGLQESCEMLPCLDNPISGHSSHPPRKILKNKAVIIPLSCLEANAGGLILEPAVAQESSSE